MVSNSTTDGVEEPSPTKIVEDISDKIRADSKPTQTNKTNKVDKGKSGQEAPTSSKRPQRKKQTPKLLLSLIPLIMMSLCLAPEIVANQNNIIKEDGIYFKHITQVTMAESAWTVVTDIDLSQIDKTIDQISDIIKRANKTQHPSGDTDFTLHLKHRTITSLNSHNERLYILLHQPIHRNIPRLCINPQLPPKHGPQPI